MIDEKEQVEKVSAKIIKEKKIKKVNPLNSYFKILIFIIFAIVIYFGLLIFFITLGSIGIYQSIMGGNLFNNFTNIPLSIVLILIGVFMGMPIFKYFKNYTTIIINLKKESQKLEA